MMAAEMKVETDVPPPSKGRKKKRDWSNVPVGGSFEFDESPSAVVSSFGFYLASGKYRIAKQPNGRYRFWRIG